MPMADVAAGTVSPAHAGIDPGKAMGAMGRGRVSPAHAGIDLSCITAIGGYPRFPRTRGDRPLMAMELVSIARFPPHTRG